MLEPCRGNLVARHTVSVGIQKVTVAFFLVSGRTVHVGYTLTNDGDYLTIFHAEVST